jgi:Response regulator containing CheY-like receiver domain and AraC-type DNA-binding domain
MKMQHKILIVDDENKSRELLTIFVRKNIPNAVIDAVDHPHVALQMLRESKYNLLLLDYEMPLMNGFEVLKEIQQMGHVPHIMLVSAYRDFDFAHKGIEIGVLEYIVKPIDNRQIEKAIKKYKRFFPDKKIEKVALPAYNGDHFVDIENIVSSKKLREISFPYSFQMARRSILTAYYPNGKNCLPIIMSIFHANASLIKIW